jgi:Heterokaryon incompatibility protein (HET)
VYAALSYTWGDASNKRRIIIEEGEHEYELLITENLHSALRHIALNIQFWINAVCINQADDVEKSWQVQQMWTVYHEAQYVAAWLGLAADDSDLVLVQITDVAKMLARDIGGSPSLERLQKLVNWRPLIDFLSLFAFSALTKRSYWRRVWIQQGLQASQNVWFHCGRKNIHLSLIDLVLGILHRMHEDRRRMNLGAVRSNS